jgi:hypothetical protein
MLKYTMRGKSVQRKKGSSKSPGNEQMSSSTVVDTHS